MPRCARSVAHCTADPLGIQQCVQRLLHAPSNLAVEVVLDPLIVILRGQSLNGASFTAVEQLQEHIDAFIAAYNETAEPFVWTKKKVHQRRFKNRRITQL